MPVAIPVGAIIAALLAMLVIWAYPVLRRITAAIVPNWHVPGFSSLRDAVLGLLDGAYSALSDALDATVYPVASFIMLPFELLADLFGRVTTAFATIRGILTLLVTVYLPLTVKTLLHDVQVAIADAKTDANAALATAIQYTKADLAAAEAYAHYYAVAAANTAAGLFHTAESDLAKGLAAAEAFTLAAKVAAENYTNAQIAQLHGILSATVGITAGDVTNMIDAAEKTINASVATAVAAAVKTAESAAGAGIGVITSDVEHVVAAAWPDVIAAVDGAIAAAGTADVDIVNELKGISRTVPLDIAGAITGVLGLSIAATRYMEECGIPNCRNLSQLGKDLQDLLGLVEDASFLALFVEMIHNPAGGADLVVDTLGSLADDAIGTAKSMLGV